MTNDQGFSEVDPIVDMHCDSVTLHRWEQFRQQDYAEGRFGVQLGERRSISRNLSFPMTAAGWVHAVLWTGDQPMLWLDAHEVQEGDSYTVKIPSRPVNANDDTAARALYTRCFGTDHPDGFDRLPEHAQDQWREAAADGRELHRLESWREPIPGADQTGDRDALALRFLELLSEPGEPDPDGAL